MKLKQQIFTAVKEFFELKLKMHSNLVSDASEYKKAKGVN